MTYEYDFSNPVINLYIVLGNWGWFLLGVYLFSTLIYKMYNSEYKKDPTFENIPKALRWKTILLAIVSIPLLGPLV